VKQTNGPIGSNGSQIGMASGAFIVMGLLTVLGFVMFMVAIRIRNKQL
jgi:hypothetical protein